MEVMINCKACWFPQGAKFINVVKHIRAPKKDNPVLQSLKKKIGEDPLMYVLNGVVIRPHEFNSIEIRAGDNIRYIYPHAGG